MGSDETRSALRELRLRARLSQRALAAKSGVSLSRINEAETGARPMSIDTALKTSRALGVDGLALYLSTVIPAIKAEVEGTSGSAGPIKAAHIAKVLIETIESGNLTPQQARVARDAARQLVDLVSEAAAKRRPGTLASLVGGSSPGEDAIVRGSGGSGPPSPPQRSSEDERREAMAELGRDMTGRAIGADGVELRKKKPKTAPDQDVPGSDATYAYKKSGEESPYDVLGRDAFGRKKNP